MTTTLLAGLREESFVEINNATFYGIPDVDRLGPFLMSILSDSNHWMFVSSRGGLTAGRGDANSALFPYETDDRLHVATGITGPITVVRRVGDASTWEPFQGRTAEGVRRNLYKSVVGDQVVFEEVNDELGLVFRHGWANSDRFGFVRTASLTNIGERPVVVDLVDGLLNVLPDGLEPATYRAMGNLTNAYKRSEVVDADARLAVFSLESLIVDRPEPAEALTATVAWSIAPDDASVSLDPTTVDAFRAGSASRPVPLMTGRPGAYLLEAQQELDPGAETHWTIVADVAYDQCQVVELLRFLQSASDPQSVIADSVERGTDALVATMARADGLQWTGDRMAAVHHFANVAFNVMRGGIFVSATQLERDDFSRFVSSRNRAVASRHAAILAGLPARVDRAALLDQVRATGDPQLIRLALDYLPLTFSRRHGDPSRPWNTFSIRVRDDRGQPVVHYEGNWRDIFQNWEALCLSFPAYLPSIVSVFLNASTPDGFNPYRITSDGIDWEVPEPDNPWSNIGYWGDHQIVYLHRLLEMTRRFLPTALDEMLGQPQFAYADVPYRIAPYEQIVRDPHNTIEYDDAAADRIASRVEQVGQDGKLVPSADDDVRLVTMIEKLLVPMFAKLSNLVPGGGIWMNTQRPEWNDANNALVGNGLSMVTACHLRRYMQFLASLFERSGLGAIDLSSEVADWMDALGGILEESREYLGGELADSRRREVVDRLGGAFSVYRARVAAAGFGGSKPVELARIEALLDTAIRHIDDTIRRNRRSDGLYHSYNLAHFAEDGPSASVEHLQPMLEGQVAVLSSGLLSVEEKLAVLEALFASSMYRPDQNSFMLYPARTLPSFLDKNRVPAEEIASVPLLGELLAAGDTTIIAVDEDGRYRFSAGCRNRGALEAALDRLALTERWRELVIRDRHDVTRAYEAVFNHHAYTGRSGSMYAYEGIGSIYWHMVAKLLVAVQESILEAEDAGADHDTLNRLTAFYWRVRSGLGFEKTAVEFGAFPMDPYSHTPAHAGAQQPGMTGQVKEEILTRPLELGLCIKDGEIRFEPALLRPSAFVAVPTACTVWAADGSHETYDLPANSLVMTCCQVPVIVSLTEGPAAIEVELVAGSVRRVEGLVLDKETSAQIFERRREVRALRVSIPATALGASTP